MKELVVSLDLGHLIALNGIFYTNVLALLILVRTVKNGSPCYTLISQVVFQIMV